MRAPQRLLLLSTILWCCLFAGPLRAETAQGGSEKRIALVVGNAAYQAGELATPANDAGLVAQTLQAAGFDVVGARDLDEDSLRRALRDFADKAAASGPDTVAFVYLSGYGLQLNGENYFAPIDAKIATAADVPVRAMRISDYKRQLAALPLKARFVVLDAGRNAPFAKTGDPLAGGLALTDTEPGSLLAFNAAPGTVGPDEKGPYGAYAQALVEMIREGGLSPDQLFDRVRLRVSETTQGGEVPWHASKIDVPFVFFQRAPDAPAIAEPEKVAALRARPLREIGARDAYTECLQRDSLQGYQEFVSAYPRDAAAKRVRVLIAARREAETWRRTAVTDSSNAYWSYLGRYPRGPHGWDARRRLRELSVPLEPPVRFAALDYDVPPPPPEEVVYVERPAVYFDDPYYELAPPPPPPVFFLPPRPAYIVDLPPPPPVYEVFALPTPAFVPVPVYVSAPDYIAPPPNNVYYRNIHDTAAIDQINQYNVAYSREVRDGRDPSNLTIAAGAVVGAAVGLAATRVALPPAVAKKAALPANGLSGGGPQTRPGTIAAPGLVPNGQVQPGQPQPNPALPGRTLTPNGQPALGQALPGQNGVPLPTQANKPGQPGLPGQPTTQQANQPGQNGTGGKPGTVQPLVGPNGQPATQQANQPGQPRIGGKPGSAQPIVGPNGQPVTQQATKPDGSVVPGTKPGLPGQPGTLQQANQPGQPRIGIPGTKAATGQTMPEQNGQALPQQADKPGQPGIPVTQQQANRPGQPRIGIPGNKPATGQALPQQANKPSPPAANVPPPKLVQPAQTQPRGPSPTSQNAAQQQQASQRAAAQQQRAAQQQAAQQRAAAQQQQASQQRAAAMQQQAAQQRAATQQQAVQQRAAAQQQQQQMAAQQRAAAQQQQAAQQRQMMMQQQQQMAQQRAAAQQRQMMARPQAQPQPQPQPRGGGGGGRPPCPPGVPCR